MLLFCGVKTSESKFAKCLYFTTNALARKTEKLAMVSWSKVDLTPSHGYLLMMVNEVPGVQPTFIADQLQLSPSTVTRLMAKLEAKKLLVRLTEGKTTYVYPTAKGKALFPRLKMCQEEFSRNYNRILANDQLDEFVKTIARMSDEL